MKAWFLSDIHLKDINERNGQTLLRFLFYLNQNPQDHQLFLLGDIFDFWVSDGRAFVDSFREIIDQITLLKKNGGEVYYFEGNHDFHIDRYWTKKFEIPVIEDFAYINLQGLNVRIEHGDFINPDDAAYLKYRAFIRHPIVEFIGHVLPSSFLKSFGESQSRKSRKKTSSYALQNFKRIQDLIRSHAHRVYLEKPFDLLVAGHMHILDEYELSGLKNVKSFNLGTWLEQPRVLLLENKKTQIIDLEDFLKIKTVSQ